MIRNLRLCKLSRMLLNRERNVRHEAWKNFCQAGMGLILEESCQHSRMKLTGTGEVYDRSFMKFQDVSVDHPKHPSYMAIVTEECRVLLKQGYVLCYLLVCIQQLIECFSP